MGNLTKTKLNINDVIRRSCGRPEVEIVSAVEDDWGSIGFCLNRGAICVFNIPQIPNFQRDSNLTDIQFYP